MKEIVIRDTRKKEKFVVDDEYLNGYAKLCGINATGVYITLCRHADFHTQECFPSVKTISEKLGISERSVSYALKKLEDWNIIIRERTRHPKNSKWVNNSYTLLDKSVWRTKPPANNADGENNKPPANNDKSHLHQVQSKVTHSIKVTHNSKAIALQFSNEIPLVLKEFEKVNMACKDFYGNTTQRNFVAKLLDTYGEDKVMKVVSFLPEMNRTLYNKATTPKELWDKWAKIEAEAQALKKKKSSNKYQITKIH